MTALLAAAPLLATLEGTLQSLPPQFLLPVIIVGIVFSWLLVATIAGEIRKHASHRDELAFKRDLVERGLDADEIEKIVSARRPEDLSDD